MSSTSAALARTQAVSPLLIVMTATVQAGRFTGRRPVLRAC